MKTSRKTLRSVAGATILTLTLAPGASIAADTRKDTRSDDDKVAEKSKKSDEESSDKTYGHHPGPYEADNGSWISLSGTIVSTELDEFRLDYAGGVITVEMDDFDFYHEGRNLLVNDEVVVFGKVDADLWERRSIEASSVYVENLNTHFYASAADEEGFTTWTATGPIQVGRLELTGHVSSVDGRSFTIDTGRRQVTVDTSDMTFNPMDDRGYLQVGKGDLVKVNGAVEPTIFDNRVLVAEWISKLH